MKTRAGITSIIAPTLLLFIYSNSLAQDKTDQITDSIITIGKELYKSETASWYGTDIFLERFKGQRQNTGGYFSYWDGKFTNCIFFEKGDNPQVLATIKFDSTYRVNNAQVDSLKRAFSLRERDIYTVRQLAVKEIASDTLFKRYNNTRFNIVPLISNGRKQVYVFTGPQNDGVVIFGNDYLLSFDEANNLVGVRRLHKNIMPIEYGKQSNQEVGITMHSHSPETGDYITSTDICTLMLYENFAKWKQHIVMSKDYVSIWNCETNQLVTLTKQAWEKIYKDQQERHPNK
jgi:hypothetical protein